MKPEQLYKKYPHIIPGSIEKTERGKIISCGKNETLLSHGTICVIKCATDGMISNCRRTRIINTSDAKQVKQCRACLKYLKDTRRRSK
jgi:hypothetical protein